MNGDKDEILRQDSFGIPFFENRTCGLMSIEEVADALGKSPNTIKNWIAKREFPFVPVGNKNMVLKESFEAWLKRKEIKPWR